MHERRQEGPKPNPLQLFVTMGEAAKTVARRLELSPEQSFHVLPLLCSDPQESADPTFSPLDPATRDRVLQMRGAAQDLVEEGINIGVIREGERSIMTYQVLISLYKNHNKNTPTSSTE